MRAFQSVAWRLAFFGGKSTLSTVVREMDPVPAAPSDRVLGRGGWAGVGGEVAPPAAPPVAGVRFALSGSSSLFKEYEGEWFIAPVR